ncbi:type II secretion system F family protein [Candidatus Ruminimicrobium bovinum]|uniref:type II secretion system F family protein n=1 Tax=Candidatus Ruminimicrobium bovinum TaxID=3242779 RepID=UPI0039B99D6E
MAKFIYKAMDITGKVVDGVMDASSKMDLISTLKSKNLVLLSVKEKNRYGNWYSRLNDKVVALTTSKSGKVSIDELAIFCRQMATLVNAGVNVFNAILDMSTMSQNKYFSKVLTVIAEDLRGGKTLSDSLAKFPKIFSNTFVSMIMVGERAGKLPKVLLDLAAFIEKSAKLRKKIKSAASYPAFIGCFFVAIMLILVLVIIPKFEAMFLSFGAELPLPTQILMNLSRFILSKLIFIIIFIVILIIIFRMCMKVPAFKLVFDKFLFKIPIFGNIYLKMLFASFFQTLSTLVASGVDIISSLQIASKTINNSYIRFVLKSIEDKVVAGEQFSEEMDKHFIFPKMIVRMTAVGEKSGQLSSMFLKITDYYNDEVDSIVASLSAIMEPILIVGMGFIVGTAVIALYLPIFNMASAMMSGM